MNLFEMSWTRSLFWKEVIAHFFQIFTIIFQDFCQNFRDHFLKWQISPEQLNGTFQTQWKSPWKNSQINRFDPGGPDLNRGKWPEMVKYIDLIQRNPISTGGIFTGFQNLARNFSWPMHIILVGVGNPAIALGVWCNALWLILPKTVTQCHTHITGASNSAYSP